MYQMSNFSNQLVKWYRLNFRQLPWRKTKNPYAIWISEIILQQTRVAQGLPYYQKFISRFPDVNTMAKAKEEDILQLWQGLGYYSRARNMHHTAQVVNKDFNGDFPSRYNELIALKGIGEYTAAAISSFSSNEKKAVLDGNVFRVLARIFGITEDINSTAGKKNFLEKAEQLLPLKNPGEHNQAIMEFGAIQCVPLNPDCSKCIFSSSCIAFTTGKINQLPVKKKKNKVKKRYFNYLVITDGKSVFMRKRTEKDIWKGLLEFPMMESNNDKLSAAEKSVWKKLKTNFRLNESEKKEKKYKHLLTHQQLHIRFEIFRTQHLLSIPGYQKIKLNPNNFPGVPQVIMKLLKNENWFQKI